MVVSGVCLAMALALASPTYNVGGVSYEYGNIIYLDNGDLVINSDVYDMNDVDNIVDMFELPYVGNVWCAIDPPEFLENEKISVTFNTNGTLDNPYDDIIIDMDEIVYTFPCEIHHIIGYGGLDNATHLKVCINGHNVTYKIPAIDNDYTSVNMVYDGTYHIIGMN